MAEPSLHAASPENGARNGHASPFGLFERSMARRYLLAKRAHGGVALVSVIAFLGIVLAVAVLIAVTSVMNGLRGDLLDRLLGAQGHVFAEGAFLDSGEETQALVDRLAAAPGVERAAPVIRDQAGIRSASAFSGVEIYGLARQDLETLEIPEGIVAGTTTLFGQPDSDVILIGSLLADHLGVRIGDAVWLISPSCDSSGECVFQEESFHVGGVFSVGMPDVDQLFVYVPLDQARSFLGRDPSRAADFIEISVADPEEIDAARDEVAAIVGRGGELKDWRDNYQSYVAALQVERNVMRLVLTLLVLIAALNIISGLVMLAKNKVGDIAILRTMGATQGAVMRIFFMVGGAIGVLGTVIGFILGTLFSANFSTIQRVIGFLDNSIFYEMTARLEWREVLFIVVFSLAASFLATLPPAWNAARLDPVEALRYG